MNFEGILEDGTCSAGKKHCEGFSDRDIERGIGCIQYVHGAKYFGQLSALEAREGYGVHQFPSGAQYNGEFFTDKSSGLGVRISSFGDIYCGEWVDGIRQGMAVHVEQHSGLVKKCIFEGDEAVKEVTTVEGDSNPMLSSIAAYFEAQKCRIAAQHNRILAASQKLNTIHIAGQSYADARENATALGKERLAAQKAREKDVVLQLKRDSKHMQRSRLHEAMCSAELKLVKQKIAIKEKKLRSLERWNSSKIGKISQLTQAKLLLDNLRLEISELTQ